MNIGKAAELAGLTVKTVRHYADIQVVIPEKNDKTGYRKFSSADVAKLQFIGKARKFGFSVQECRELLALYEDTKRSSREVKALTLMKIAEIDHKLQELKSLRSQLTDLASSCQGNERPDCPILNALSSEPIQ
ncbi:MerR family DNA-binding protein [Alphaproteobacteria bacterium]|jgi:Cu(I)-responsive transcriptional regulator|nr:MerR family DNA-binding protein [Rhodospirillaceae bacterium]MBT6305623.1 MerR family DNA-binding protein [Rhodospirillaceae bacterium]MDC0998370.1 MerR family DNA-binding protein [Alphaproteobacteria bacterium]MDG1274865.1 MerR family DNA-binding protein [Alphaproteobacteria bacterium]